MSRTPGSERSGAERSERSSAGVVGLRHPPLDAKRLIDSESGSTEIEQLVCGRCQPLEALIDQYEATQLEMGEVIARLEDELAGREGQLRSEGAKVTALKRELRQVRESEPGAEVVEKVLEHWMKVTGRQGKAGRRPSIEVAGKRGQTVKKALRLKDVRTGKAYRPEDLMEALTGLGLLPYVGPKGRQRTDRNGAKRYDEVEHALGDETKIDRFVDHARRAAGVATSESMLQAWWQAAAMEAEYASLVLMTWGRSPEQVAVTLAARAECDAAFDALEAAA